MVSPLDMGQEVEAGMVLETALCLRPRAAGPGWEGSACLRAGLWWGETCYPQNCTQKASIPQGKRGRDRLRPANGCTDMA